MKKFLLIILSLLMLTGCRNVQLNSEWYPMGPGRDDVYICAPDGKFNLGKYADIYALTVNGVENNQFNDTLLTYVDYYTEDDKFYACSSEGFCIVDELENTAQVFIRVEKQRFTDGPVEDSAVTYLTAFDEFPSRAREIFLQMDEYTENREERLFGYEFTKGIDGKIRPFDETFLGKALEIVGYGFYILNFFRIF